jgi:RNA recognition motif-containing protein
MSIDPFSGRNPSYCFVDLDDNEDTDAVIRNLQGYQIRGRPSRSTTTPESESSVLLDASRLA